MEQLKRKTQCHYTVARMPYAQYIEERRNQFERQEMIALSERREKKIRDEKLRKIEQRVDYELNAISRQDPGGARLLKKKMKAVKSMEKRFEREDENMTLIPEQAKRLLIILWNV